MYKTRQMMNEADAVAIHVAASGLTDALYDRFDIKCEIVRKTDNFVTFQGKFAPLTVTKDVKQVTDQATKAMTGHIHRKFNDFIPNLDMSVTEKIAAVWTIDVPTDILLQWYSRRISKQ